MFGVRYNAQQQKEAFGLPENIKAVFNQLARAFQVSIQSRDFQLLFQEALIEFNAPDEGTPQQYMRHGEQTQAEAQSASHKFQEKTTQRGRFTGMLADWTIEPEETAYTARTP